MRRRANRTLVLGGARSGKSHFAEQLLSRDRAVDYVACGAVPGPDDPEWVSRVELHQARRRPSWITKETVDVAGILQQPGSPALIDCLTTWLARTMDDCGIWSESSGADDRLATAVDALVEAWGSGSRAWGSGSRNGRRAVMVSNEVGSSIVPATVSGRRFRDELGQLNARVAASSDRVWLLTAGLPQRLR